MNTRALLIGLLSFTLSCMNTSIVYYYSDGNANEYILTRSELKYIPMKPDNSSSGVYDGGDAKSIIISEVQYINIQKFVEKALNNPTIHTPDRVMMSAQIIKQEDNAKKMCIIKPGSKEIASIEEEFRKVLEN